MKRFFTFDKFNTWHDWRLIVTAKSIPDPEPKTNYVELDGASGSLDLTEALTGEPSYKDRTLTASFSCSEGTRVERERLLRTIAASLHGRKVKIIEPDAPEHYFLGRVKIKSLENHPAYATFDIEATCDPWRYALYETERTVTGAADVVLYNSGVKSLCPTITVIGAVSITYKGTTTALTAGSYRITDIRLTPGANVIGVTGTGTVTFTYREAML